MTTDVRGAVRVFYNKQASEDFYCGVPDYTLHNNTTELLKHRVIPRSLPVSYKCA